MRLRWRWLLCASALAAGTIEACTGDDESFEPSPRYAYDAATFDRAPPPVGSGDAFAPSLACGDAGDAPPRLLITNRDRPELAALNLDRLTVDGRYVPDGGASDPDAGFTVTSSSANSDPWLVDEAHDLVTRLDAREPWKPGTTWDVHGDDGAGPSRPSTVVQVSCTKAYVLRKNRDRIAIIDPSQSATNVLTPSTYVDLSGFRAAGDTGLLDLAGAVFVPAKKKVFVLAANIDPTKSTAPFGLGCTDLVPVIFAIDIATDTIVSLAGKGPAGSIELAGFDTIALLYDAPFDRLLAVSAGCYAPPGDGNAGQLKRRMIEQVDLATGAVTSLLSLDPGDKPTGLALVDGEHALITFGHRAAYWNPHESTLGPELEGDLDLAALDGRGGFAGTRRSADGGLDLIRIPIDPDAGGDRGVRVLATDPFSARGGRASSLEPWPHR